MNAAIYRVSSDDAIDPLPRTSFGTLNISENSHLQKWVLANPQVLGEELLVITNEYDGFDKSRKRLDILALDKDGKLVVVELKLATTGSFADLQGINYAAMVSTMTMKQALDLHAKQHKIDSAAAEDEVRGFLELEFDDDELPELDDQPRIIIAAGSFGGHEITSTALWLRTFRVDIKLVEIAPYRASSGEFILVPRVVITIPEAEEYMVGHERKESAQRTNTPQGNKRDYSEFLSRVHALAANTEEPELRALLGSEHKRTAKTYLNFPATQDGELLLDHHYEWSFNRFRGFLVGLHFERKDAEAWNRRMGEWFTDPKNKIDDGSQRKLEVHRHTGKTHWLGYTLIKAGEIPDLTEEHVKEAVVAMEQLYSRTAKHVPEARRQADELEAIKALSLQPDA